MTPPTSTADELPAVASGRRHDSAPDQGAVALPQPRAVDDVVPRVALPVLIDDFGVQRLSNGDKLLDVAIDRPGNDDLTTGPLDPAVFDHGRVSTRVLVPLFATDWIPVDLKPAQRTGDVQVVAHLRSTPCEMVANCQYAGTNDRPQDIRRLSASARRIAIAVGGERPPGGRVRRPQGCHNGARLRAAEGRLRTRQ